MIPEKKHLRNHMKLFLSGLSPSYLEDAARQTRPWLDQIDLSGLTSVLLYQPLLGELPSYLIRDWAIQRGLRVFYPRTREERLNFLEGSPEHFVDDERGFRGPTEGSPRWEGHSALLFAPALAVDVRGYRLGRGGGFFDRFLASHPTVFSVLHVLNEQIRSNLPVDPWDVPFRAILSPGGLQILPPA